MATIPDWRRNAANPARTDRPNRLFSAVGTGSGPRPQAWRKAATKNDALSTAIATGAVSSWTSTPPSPGPATDVIESVNAMLLFAAVSCRRFVTSTGM